jgi:1,2-diacylglycerol 3-beta-glucosyltransferase
MTSTAATGDHRRAKSAAFLFACGCAGAAPHWLDPARSLWPAISLALMLGGYALRIVLRAELLRGPSTQGSPISAPLPIGEFPTA